MRAKPKAKRAARWFANRHATELPGLFISVEWNSLHGWQWEVSSDVDPDGQSAWYGTATTLAAAKRAALAAARRLAKGE